MTDTDILAFLKARLDEDEQWARAASAPYRYADAGAKPPPDGVHWRWVTGDEWEPAAVDPVVSDLVADGDPVWLATVETWQVSYSGTDVVRHAEATHGQAIEEMAATWAGHITRHDPSRVLREVAAKRRMLAAVERWHDPHPGLDCTNADDPWEPCELHAAATGRLDPYVLKLLAACWSGHPDYNPSWTVE